MYLMAANVTSLASLGNLLLVILEVAFGLGMVIFVHELGHFLVAKWCGVKCEKFYLGFDIGGLKLAKFQKGETEYGIGILPLGGYVKMLGQDDNPGKAVEERERSTVGGGDGQPAALDPRSYMAKSVPQRMAIISAGVIMNVIFAFITAIAAYKIGVEEMACGISEVLPGEAAWRADLRPGDMFTAINDKTGQLRYRDLMTAVALADMEKGVEFKVKRPGVPEEFWVKVHPEDKKRLKPTIGVQPPLTARLAEIKPFVEGTPAASVEGLQPGDIITAVGDVPVASYSEFLRELTLHPAETLDLEVEHAPKDGSKETTKSTVSIGPRSARSLGLVMKPGEVTAIKSESAAAEAGLQIGDQLLLVDGQPIDDPLRLPEQLRRKAGQTATLTIARQGKNGSESLEKQVTLRPSYWPEASEVPGSPVSIPALGLTFEVSNVVAAVRADGPAAAAELKNGKTASEPRIAAGNEIVKVEFVVPKRSADDKVADTVELITQPAKPIELAADKPNWPFVMNQLQWLPAGSTVKLTLKDGRTATVEPQTEADWYLAERGLRFDVELVTIKANDFSEAVALGTQEAKDAVTQVYSFLRRIGTQISPYGLGGPVAIAGAAAGAASEGLSKFLVFLTMLSANLAVINFLPIPLLDGGHMVFLILEGIRGKPVNERVVVAFHYLGFVFIISLMIFVLGLDFGLIPRPH